MFENLYDSENMYSTKELQLESLLVFMNNLGYCTRYQTPTPRYGFERFDIVDSYAIRNPECISFEMAVMMHNGFISRVFAKEWFESLSLPQKIKFHHDTLTEAYNSRKVEQVKLQRDRKQHDGIRCQSHWIKEIKNEK
ncbi:hypothetical protein NVP1170O_062 [Vibrio phage 1.170.O._10N.261.52.C3]|nr:hypothetical protein NVP1170O_062 [Vibrio phage 1.170.O._10N.261.52.C3]